MSKKIANAFNDGDAVLINASATKINGDPLPQAGKRGVIAGNPGKGRYMVDVPGFPLVNLPADDLEAAIASTAARPAAISPAAQGPATAYAFDVLQLSAIVASKTNPRIYFDVTALASLAEDIKINGILQPILVRKLPADRLSDTFTDRRKGDALPGFEIVAGERRYRAATLAGVRSVPVLIRELTDEQVLRMQLIENVQRQDLHPLEEAQGYRRILDLNSQIMKSMAQRVDELASSIARSTRYIYQTLQLLKLAEFPRQVFIEGKLQRSVALQISTIGNEAGQIEATRRIAGLHRTGTSTEVVDNPMSQREAASYVAGNYRLLLSKAPFPIKVKLAGVDPCGVCPSMSANVKDLFEENAKVPDTCLDSSCYGKKNAAHALDLAEVARRNGQRVITGAEAKKLIPYDGRQKSLDGAYESIDAKQFTDIAPEKQGQTIRQLLGKDMPLPVLIADPHQGGFVEALPAADVKRLLKERGLIQKSTDEKAKEAERKVKLDKAYRLELATQLLAKVDIFDASDLLDKLLIPLAAQAYKRLDNDSTKRLHKLLGWESTHIAHDDVITELTELTDTEFCQFIVAACVSGELHVAEYFKPKETSLQAMAELLSVDPKAVKSKIHDDAKALEKAKAAKQKPKAAPASAKSKAVAAPKPANKTQWREPTKVEAAAFAIGLRVRVVSGKGKLPASTLKYAGKVGTLESQCGPEAWFLSIDSDKSEALTSGSFHYTELQIEVPAPAKVPTNPAAQTALDLPAPDTSVSIAEKAV